MTRLLVLFDQDDYECVKQVRPEALSGTILVHELPLHLTLLDERVAHHTSWDFFTPNELTQAVEQYEAALDFWNSNAEIPYSGVDLLKTCRNRHTGFLARMTWAACVFERVFDQLQPSEVLIFEEPPAHGLPTPLDFRKIPTLFMLLRGMAEHRNIPVDLITLDEQQTRPLWSDKVAATVSQEIAEPVDIQSVLAGRPFVLFAGSGIDTVHHLPLIHTVAKEGSRTPLQLYRNVSNEYLQSLRESGHLLFHDSQIAPGARIVENADFAIPARQRFDEAAKAAPSELRSVFANKRLNPHFDFLFSEYTRKLAQQVENWSAFYQACRPDLVISSFPSIANDVAVARGIPGLAMPHAIHPAGMLELLAQCEGFHICANAEKARQPLEEMGIPEERIHLVVDPVVEESRRRYDTEPGRHRERIRKAIRDSYGINEKQHLLLVLSGGYVYGTLHSAMDFPDWKSSVQLFDELGTLAKAHPDWRWVYRGHPRFDEPRIWARAAEKAEPGQLMRDTTGTTLFDQVLAADAIVLVGAGTSVQLEAALMRSIPIYMMKQCLPWYRPEKYNLDKWPLLPSVEALGLELEWLFASRENWHNRSRMIKELVRDYFGQAEPGPVAWIKVVNQIALPISQGNLAGSAQA